MNDYTPLIRGDEWFRKFGRQCDPSERPDQKIIHQRGELRQRILHYLVNRPNVWHSAWEIGKEINGVSNNVQLREWLAQHGVVARKMLKSNGNNVWFLKYGDDE